MDEAYADTDSDMEFEEMKNEKAKKLANIQAMFRMSSRVASLKRRGLKNLLKLICFFLFIIIQFTHISELDFWGIQTHHYH